MRYAAALFLVLILFSAPAYADQFADGETAWNKGDYKTAFQILRPLAEQGNAKAQEFIGELYDDSPLTHGRSDIKRDFVKAFKWHLKAAEQGDVTAQNNVEASYEHGIGVQVDYAEAVKWLRKAADRGDGMAEVKLGQMYEIGGPKLKQDNAEAYFWYLLAANDMRYKVEHHLTRTQRTELEKRVTEWQKAHDNFGQWEKEHPAHAAEPPSK